MDLAESTLFPALSAAPFPAVQAWVEFDGLPVAVAQMRWREGLGRPYEIDAELVADLELDPAELLGRTAHLTMRRGAAAREVHGIVQAARRIADRFDRSCVAVEVVPALALSRMNRRSRIFQDMTVAEIAVSVLQPALERRGSRLDVSRLRPPRRRDYCVQYRESDLGFVERLLAEEQISYVFEQERDTEVVVLLDADQVTRILETVDGRAVLEARDHDAVPVRETISGIERALRMRPVRARARRWDWGAPSPGPVEQVWQLSSDGTRIESAPDTGGWEELELDVHERGRGVEDDVGNLVDDAERVGSIVLGEEHVRAAMVRMQSDAVGAGPGARFELRGTHDDDAAYVVTEVVHRFEHATAMAASNEGTQYRNDMLVLPAEIPWQAQHMPARPTIAGVQTATVVGPPGEDVHTDAHGRIRVLLHWDRDGRAHKQQDASFEPSCWLRATQSWAGPGFGAQFVPRVGTQVLVAFLDGDPDRPICIGGLYDGHDRHPFELPEDRTRSGWRTRSTRGEPGYNELSFEDDAGREEIRLRAQRNLNEHVRANHTTSVDGDRTSTVGGRRVTRVAGGEELASHGGMLTTVFGGHQEYVEGGPSFFPMPGAHPLFKRGVVSHLHVNEGERYVQCSHAIRMHGGAGGGGNTAYLALENDEIRLEVGGSSIVLRPEGIEITTTGYVRTHAGTARVDIVSDRGAGHSVLEIAAHDFAVTTAGAVFTMDSAAGLVATDSIELQRGATRLRLDEIAALSAPHVSVEGIASVEVKSPGTCAIEAATTVVSGQMTRIEGAQVTVADDAGGTVAITGGIIRLN